tara:strand:+ start:3647 stop:3880 length:234 start_codon:yes stop_codon:yes gene_type:complete
MLIPVKCFTCGKVLADKYRAYERMVRQKKSNADMTIDGVTYLTSTNTDKTPEGEVMDELKLNKYCCRRHMLTHVNIE